MSTKMDKETMNYFAGLLVEQKTSFKETMDEQMKALTKNNNDNTEQIKKSIAGLAQNVAQNTESITNISNRVDNIENEFKDIHSRLAQLEQGPSTAQEHIKQIAHTQIISQEIQEKIDITKADITRAARKIIAITPITDEDLERNSTPQTSQNDLLLMAASEFLQDELKYTEDECRALDILKITRPRTPDTDRLYLHFATEKSAEYLQRRTINMNSTFTDLDRPKPNTKMFIPPQLRNRFYDLNKLCYDKRQENSQYKTRITLGEEDLVLAIREPDAMWKNVELNVLGPISPPEWHKVWPRQETPIFTSPPKGRYVSHKRSRSEDDQSGEESDDSSSQDTGKRHRQQSPPQHKQQPKITQGTQNNGTPNLDKQDTSLVHDPSRRTVQQKIFEAEGWANLFDKNKAPAIPNMDPATTAVSKNGGTTKGTKAPTPTPALTATQTTKTSKDTKKKPSK